MMVPIHALQWYRFADTVSNMLFAKYHIRHQRPHYHTETRPSDDNQDDNYIALLILIGGLSIGGYLLYRKRKINKYRRG